MPTDVVTNMTTTPYSSQFEEEFIIRDLDTLKVVADSLRMQILDLLREKPLTVKQLAADLDITPTKLYYHINLMEKHGLIRVVDTRLVSGILEKRYQAAARLYRFDHRLLTPNSTTSDEGIEMMLSTMLDETKADIKKGVREGLIELEREPGANVVGTHSLLVSRILSRLQPGQAKAFYDRLDELIDEFAELRGDPDNAEEQIYSLLIALYPTMRGTHRYQDDDSPIGE